MGIVLDLQKLAIDSNCDVLSLLRKAYFVSRKLDIVDFQEWITYELNGYNERNIVPQYRKITGALKGFNPYHGWIPVIIPDKELEKTICNHILCDSIPKLVNMIENQGNNMLTVTLPGEIIQNICVMTGYEANYTIQLTSSSIVDVIEQVKNRILDWSMLLEENGIIGADLQFTDDEKAIVHNNPQIINYVSNTAGNYRFRYQLIKIIY